jgi:hypothetical protein
VGQCCEAATFQVRQAQPPPAELGFEHTVFFKKVRDDLLLVSLEPASHHSYEHVQHHGLPSGGDRDIIVRSSIQRTRGISMD